MLCKFCREERTLVNSHIIPKSFFKVIAPDNDSKIIGSQGNHPKRSPQGIYDKIVCDVCEKRFEVGDDYIIKFFNKKDFNNTLVANSDKAHVIKEFDLDKLNQFIASLLWRASVTSKVFYERVNLGKKYESLLLSYIISNGLFPSQIQYIFKKYQSVNTIISPIDYKIDGLNGYIFHFGEWDIYVKVDERKLSGSLSLFADHSKEIWVMETPYKGSPAHSAAVSLAKKNQDLF